MSAKMKKSFAKEMLNLEAASLLRIEVPAAEEKSLEVSVLAEVQALNFFSNDFLGWLHNAEMKKRVKQTVTDLGLGSTSSRATLGTSELLTQLEEKLCAFLKVEACIVLSSRMLANLAIFDALTNERDSIFIDEGSDPTLVDGARFSRAKTLVYNTRDQENLEYCLKCSASARYRIIASDAVFNFDGRPANFQSLHTLKKRYDAITVLDDSLGIGLMGEQGQGSFADEALPKPDLISGSFAYALGHVSGGFVAGDRTLIEWLRQSSRPYIISEPLSTSNAAAALHAIDVLSQGSSALEKLHRNATKLREKLRAQNWEVLSSDHPIISILIGNTLITQKMVESLYEMGVYLSGLCYPNVPEGAAILRIHPSAKHSEDQLDQLVAALAKVKPLLAGA